MTEKEIIELMVGRIDALNDFWNLYLAVCTGIIGIMASGKVDANGKRLKLFFSLAFLIFAFSNLFGILSLNEFRRSLLELLINLPAVKLVLKPVENYVYIVTHGLMDLIIVLSIWLIKWPQKSK